MSLRPTLNALLTVALLTAPAHAANVFSRLDPGTTRLLATTGLARTTSGATFLAVDEDAMSAFRAGEGGTLVIPESEGASVELVLEPYDVQGPGGVFTYTDDAGRHEFQPDVSLYRGRVVGEDGSWAVVALSGAGVQAIVERDGRRWTVSPVQRSNAAVAAATAGIGVHAFAPEGDLSAAVSRFDCGVDADHEADLSPGSAPSPGGLAPTAPQAAFVRMVVRSAVDCDYEVYANKFGANLTAATAYILTLLGTVNLIDERDLEITCLFPLVNLWTTINDPYTQSTTGNQLPEFAGYWGTTFGLSSSTYRMAHLLSGRSLGGGIAYLSGVCAGNGYCVSQIDGTYTYPTTTSTWDAMVVAHEYGHSLGSWHTHSCQWLSNGYVTSGTIDSCYTPEGSCNTVSNRLPPLKGTIMSYCHLIGGTAAGIRMDFHPICVQRIRSVVSGCNDIPTVNPPFNPIASSTSSGATLSWSAGGSSNVRRYSLYRSRVPLDLNAAYLDTTKTLNYTMRGLGTYYVRMRTVRLADSSSFSGEVKAVACPFTSGSTVVVGSQPTAALSEDFNEDGIQDVALVTAFGGNLVTLRGQGSAGVGNGTFAAPVSVVTGASPAALLAHDVDGDGILDLVVGEQTVGSLVWHRGNGTAGVGDGTFAAVQTLAALPFLPTDLAAADLDEDGILDLVVAGGSSGFATLRGNGTAGVPDGTFAAAVSVSTGSISRNVLPYDFNADGITDLAVSGTGVRLLFGTGSGGKGDGGFTVGPLYSTGTSPRAMATGDLDLDGITDLVVCNTGTTTISVLLGNDTGGVPTGTFATPLTVSAGQGPNAVQIADWDENGVPDLAVASNSTSNVVSVLQGLGTGAFEVPQTFATGSSLPISMACNDFNEDGTPDFLVCLQGSQAVVRTQAGCSGLLGNSLTLVSPNGGEQFLTGSETTVTWTKGAGVMTVDLQRSTDGGANWRTLARGLTGTSYRWTAAGPTSQQVRLRVVDSHSAQYSDASDAVFSLIDPALLDVDGQPLRLALQGAWPNPTRGDLAVSFSLPVGAKGGVLELIDLAGRRVAARDLHGLGAGRHRVALLEGRTLPAGLYLVRLSQGGEVRSLKVAVLR